MTTALLRSAKKAPALPVVHQEGALQHDAEPAPEPARVLVSNSNVDVKLLDVLHCWNLRRNYQALFKSDGGISGMRVFNGMRVLAIMCIVLGHTFARLSFGGLSNLSFAQVVMGRLVTVGVLGNSHIMANGTGMAYLSVDTFFFFSGFLAFYSMLSAVTMVNSAGKFAYGAVLHRWCRLTPMYFFVLMVYIYLFPAMGDGPNWREQVDGYLPFCKRFWWTNILYVNNLYPCQWWHHDSSWQWDSWGNGPNPSCADGDAQLGCYVHTWYLSNDMQMFVFAAVPGALLSKWRLWASGAYVGALAAGSLAYSAALMSRHHGTTCDMMICPNPARPPYPGQPPGPAFCSGPATGDMQVTRRLPEAATLVSRSWRSLCVRPGGEHEQERC
jgi:hypothetical protein